MSIATEITRLNNNIDNLKQIKQGIKTAVNNDFNEITDEKIENYADKIKDTFELYKDQIPSTTTEKLIDIDINDAMVYSKNKLNVFGRTEQTQLTGKNKYNKSQNYANSSAGNPLIQEELSNGIRIKQTSNVSIYSFICYAICNLNNYIGKTVRLKTNMNPSGNNVPEVKIGLSSSTCTNRVSKAETFTSGETISFVVPELTAGQEYLCIWLYVTINTAGETNDYVDYTNLIITIDNEDISYEPYCGAVASPNPDYPQEIQNVEGRECRNLLNLPNGNGTIRGVNYIVENQQIKLNGTITSGDPWLIITTNAIYGINGTPSASYIVGKIDNVFSIGVVKGFLRRISGTPISLPTMRLYDIEGNYITDFNSETKVCAIAIYLGATGKIFKDYILGAQINTGTIASPYEPYFQGKQISFNILNQNLAWHDWAADCVSRVNSNTGARIEEFDNKYCLLFLPNTGYGEYDTKYLFKTKFKENTRYTFVFDIYNTAGNANLSIHYTDGTSSNFGGTTSNTWKTIIYTSAVNKTIKYITPAYYAGTKHLDLDTFMVLEGVYTAENLPGYVENKSQTIPFPLQDGQKLMEGDYLAENGVHHTRGIVVLNGTELYQKNQVYDNVFFIDNILQPRAENLNALCNYFAYGGEISSSANLELNKIYSWGIGEEQYRRRIVFCIEMETRDELKAWIAEQYSNGMPIIVEYSLAEDVIEPYTQSQQQAYNQLVNLTLNKDINYIWTETDGVKPNIQLIYKSKSLN